ncbi:hypothetical protein HO133_009103 [Letharia lupina]|uniref:INO80 complex, subunit Ies4 n=1 Tax=Letharia lupina TaxID=560253 RepID=A0A8H6FF64_9LECA|nr:uncharacterized protein HO133_009103 [Letharia lupina]KAF6226237.1 hypothetical protein HO133_009103 [Letharia lupina]
MAPGSKAATAPRRVSSTLSKVSTLPTTATPMATTNARPIKPSKPSKVVNLKLSKDKLSRFPHEQAIRKPSQPKKSPLSTSTTVPPDEPALSAPIKSEPETTASSNENGPVSSPIKDVKQEALPAPKPGVKRELGAGVESEDKDKPKNPPRKRARPEGKPDGRTAAARLAKGVSGPGAGTSHKLGPKANQGAINAGLRALDRTSKSCRKWEKTGFRVKSFTGRIWEIPSWKAPTAKAFGSEAESGQGTPNSQSKENSSSNIGSDKSPAVNPSNIASSPAPAIAIPA